MNLSTWSIRNPVPANLLFISLTLLGLYCFNILGIQNFPDVDIPIVTVTARLEGAAPAQLESDVARKIEDAVAPLNEINHIRTTLVDGMARVAIEFKIDKDSDIALNEVRNAVDGIRSDLPPEMPSPVVSKRTTSGTTLIAYTVESGDMDLKDLSWYVDNEISRAMVAVPGVGRFTRVGGVDREVQIDLDPVRMAALGVSAAEVSAQLKRVQQDASGGRGDIGGNMQTFRTLGAVGKAEQLAELPIPLADGRKLRLSDIARISDGIAEPASAAMLDGRPVVAFEITRSRNTSEVTVAEAVRAGVAKFQAEHPQVTIKEAYNSYGRSIDNFAGSMQLLYEGAIIAIIIVWWFLRDWRATVVTAAALPLSIIPTFLAMKLLGFTLNTMSLLAIALVVGILVDDAIVEIENIVRHLRLGKTPYQAAMEAVDEIGVAVIATTLTLVAVFLPTAFIGGIPGRYFYPFGVTAAVAILASLLVARVLTPMMAAYLLKPAVDEEQEPPMMRRYLEWVRWCLDHRKTTVFVSVVFMVISLMLTPLLPRGFIPIADRAQINVGLELPPGGTLADSVRAAGQAQELLRGIPEITTIYANIGSSSSAYQGISGEAGYADPRRAMLTINLTHRRDRALKQTGVEEVIRQRLRELPGVRVSVVSGEPGSQLRVPLTSNDSAALNAVVKEVEKDLRTLKGIGNINSSASLQRPEIHIAPDFERAADLGITAEALANTVRVATAGDYMMQLSKLNLPQRQVPIRVRLDPSMRGNIDAIRQIPLKSRSGPVPLEAVAGVEIASSSAQIDRFDRQRSVSIEVELAERVLGDVLAEANALPSLRNLPPAVQRMNTGDAEHMKDLFHRFGLAMIIGVTCIYIVLVLLFHDFMQPVTILAALPLSLGGAFVALLMTHNALSMPSVFGLLILMGIVTKNSILIVDYTITARREHGMGRTEALLDACFKRARPILMTTIAMIGGMLPVALGLGAEPSFRSPMAIAVIGGLITSTLLSLLVIPVVFTYIDDLKEFGKSVARRFYAPQGALAQPQSRQGH